MSDDRRPGFPQVPDPTQVLETARMSDQHGRGGYRIVEGVSHMTWFGPLQPIEPAVRPEMAEVLGVLGRRYDYPVGYNLRIIPRQEEPLSFEQLRGLAQSFDILKLAIETRKDEYASLKWRFVAREGYTATDSEIKEETEFWQSPDKQNNWDEWLRALMHDRFVLDAATIYPRPTKKGEIQKSAKGATYCFELLDGATVKPLVDGCGRLPRPPSIAYQQIIKGMPAVEYTTEELVYRPRNVRTNHVYGFPEVEQIALTVNIALRRELHKLQYYTEGNVPEALIGVPKEWSIEQIATYQAYWDSILAGNTAERRHAKFVPDGSKYIPTKDGAIILKNDFDEWIARVICYCFSISPAAFVKMMNRASAQTQQETAQEQGLLPGMRWITNLVNYLVWTYRNKPNLQFSWEEEKSTDPLVQTQIMGTWIDKKIQSPRQCAALLGLDYDPEEFIEPAKIAETIQPGQGVEPAVPEPGQKAGSAKQGQTPSPADSPDKMPAQEQQGNSTAASTAKNKSQQSGVVEASAKKLIAKVAVIDMPRDQQKAVFASEGDTGKGSGKKDKVAAALRSHVPATAAAQRQAEANEEHLAKAIGGERSSDNKPFDVSVGDKHLIEVKTIVIGKNDKITMHPDSRQQKIDAASVKGAQAHTVVFDDRNNAVYYRAGVGSFRLGSMENLGSKDSYGPKLAEKFN